MLMVVLNGLVEWYKLVGELMGEVVGGVVMKYFCDFNLVCEFVLSI